MSVGVLRATDDHGNCLRNRWSIGSITGDMGFRFRRSIRIAPGIRWNIGKRSTSFSLGRRGATVNVGSRGTRATVGIPGTGISYTSPVTHSHSPQQTSSLSSSGSRTARQIGFSSVVLIVGGLLAGSYGAVLVGGAGLIVAWLLRKSPAQTVSDHTITENESPSNASSE
jgi:hypothetical protein